MMNKKIIVLSLIAAMVVLPGGLTLPGAAHAQTTFVPAVDGSLWLPRSGNPNGFSWLYQFNKASTTIAMVNNTAGSDTPNVAVDDNAIFLAGQGPIVKLSKATGQVLGVVPNEVLTQIFGTYQHNAGAIALDSTDAWVSYSATNHPPTILAINKATLAIDKTISGAGSGSYDQGIAVDQNYVWAATGGSVQKIDKNTGAVVATIPTGSMATGVALGGNYVWVADFWTHAVTKIDRTTDAVVATIPVGRYSWGHLGAIAADNTSVWVVDQTDPQFYKIDETTDAVTGVATWPSYRGVNMTGVAFDDTYVWVIDDSNGEIFQFDKTTNKLINSLVNSAFYGMQAFGDFAGGQYDAVFGTPPDTTAPISTATYAGTAGQNNWYTSNVTVTVAATDNTGGSGVKSVSLCVDQTNTCTPTAGTTATISTQGTNYVRYQAVDNAGNVEALHSDPVKIDMTAPVSTAALSGTLGQNNWYTSAVTVALSATDAAGGSGVNGVEVCVDQNNTCVPTAIAASASVSTEGMNYVRYQAVDNAGNVEALHSTQVQVDTMPPASSITSPVKDDTITASPATVTVSVSDATSGTASVTVNGVAATLTSGTAQSGVWTASVPVTVPPAAGSALTFTTSATDLAGNTASSPMITVDDDGIVTAIDHNASTNADESLIYSSDFNDGTTFGSITSRGGWNYSVIPTAAAGTIEASLSGSGSNTSMVVCGNKVQVSMQKAGDTVDITCGTDPATGLLTTTATAVKAATSISLREPQTGKGKAVKVNLSTGQTVTLGSFILPAASNAQPLSIEVVDENDVVLDTGSLLPGQEVNIDPNATNGILIENLSAEPVTLIMDGTPVTIAPNQVMTDQCPSVAGNAGDTGCPFANDTVTTIHIVDQAKSGVCGTLSNGKPAPECTQPLPSAQVKVFDRENADFVKQFGKGPSKDKFASIFGATTGLIGSCATDVTGSCAVGETQPGHLLVVAQMTGTDGTKTYDGKIINFKNSASMTADKQANDDSDADNAVPSAGTVVTKRMQFNETITKTGAFKYQALSQGQTLWALALDVLGATANVDQVKSACKVVAQNNGIGVPEWGIAGNTADHELAVGTLIDISGLNVPSN
ncbi:hypothetical protein KGO95_03475 [Patescibacteria group bacterium]|nr:hypothetical protein [Patescibacteria group bacterium]